MRSTSANTRVPTTAPLSDSMPPSTSMARVTNVRSMLSWLACTTRLVRAKRPPATPAITPEAVKVMMRCVTTLMPDAAAAVPSSRAARSRRAGRVRWKSHATMIAPIAKSIVSQTLRTSGMPTMDWPLSGPMLDQ